MAQNQVYNVLDSLKAQLLQHPQCNTVTTGNLSDVDLAKTTIFPLTHLIIDTTTISSRTITVTLNVLCMDIVDISKDKATDNFYGNDNSQDVLNTQLNVLNYLFMQLKRGDLWDVRLITDNDLNASPFMEKYENMLAGWEGSIQIQMPNQIAICNVTEDNGQDEGDGQVPDYGDLPLIVAHSTNFILLDSPFTYVINARNNPTSYGATGLVGGLTLDNSTGIITGQLNTAGGFVDGLSFPVTISATNSVGTETRTISFQTTNQTSGTLLAPYDLEVSSTEGVSVTVSFRLRDYDGVISGAEIYRQGLLHDTIYFTGNESEFSKRTSITSIDRDGEYTYKVRLFNSAGDFSEFTDEILHDSVFASQALSINESVVKTNPTLDDAIIYCKFNSSDTEPLTNLVDSTYAQWNLSTDRQYGTNGISDTSLLLPQSIAQAVTFPTTHQFITGNTHPDPNNYNNSEDNPLSISLWFKAVIPESTGSTPISIPLFTANDGQGVEKSFTSGLYLQYDNGSQKLDTSRMEFFLTDYREYSTNGKDKNVFHKLSEVVTDEWNHVCIIYNGLPRGSEVKPVRIYLNNKYYGGPYSGPSSEPVNYEGMTSNPTNFIIGSKNVSQYKPEVEYDELSVFSRVLTKDEVNFLYNDGLGQSIT